MSQYCNIFIACDWHEVQKTSASSYAYAIKKAIDNLKNEDIEVLPHVINPIDINCPDFESIATKVRKSDLVIAIFTEDSNANVPLVLAAIAHENRIPVVAFWDGAKLSYEFYYVLTRTCRDISVLTEYVKNFYLS